MTYPMYEVLLRMAKESPLNVLRTLRLTSDQLERLSIFLRRMDSPELADLLDAEAAMRKMLSEKGFPCLLN